MLEYNFERSVLVCLHALGSLLQLGLSSRWSGLEHCCISFTSHWPLLKKMLNIFKNIKEWHYCPKPYKHIRDCIWKERKTKNKTMYPPSLFFFLHHTLLHELSTVQGHADQWVSYHCLGWLTVILQYLTTAPDQLAHNIRQNWKMRTEKKRVDLFSSYLNLQQ